MGVLIALLFPAACLTDRAQPTEPSLPGPSEETEGLDARQVQETDPVDEALVRRGRNVLLITLDTLRWDYVSCYDKSKVSTPNIDALAARGTRFEQAVVQVPLTLPSHASILTGTYPQVHQVRDIGGFVLGENVPTIGTIARSGGLKTAAFVGAAVLHHRFQVDAGFDHYNDSMDAVAEEEKLPGVVAEVRAEVVTRRAIDWLKEAFSKGVGVREGEPGFLVWVHYYDPHRPYDPPPPFKSKYPKDPYAGESAYTDAQVGKLLDFLAESGVEEETLVVLIADHGESLGEHGEFTHGVFLYESTMRVPFIVAGPGVLEGQVVSQQVRSIDVMPTIADYLNLEAGELVQGASLMPALVEGRGVRTTYSYMETLYPKTHMAWAELRGVRTQEWKLIISPRPELYRLETDPLEEDNVVKRFPADADRLQKQVWTVAGPPEDLGTIDYQPLDEESREELKSLGYVSAGIRREIRIDMSGPDAKDRVTILRVLETAGEQMNEGRFADAAQVLEEAVEQDQTNPLLYQHLGLCWTQLGRYRKALEVYQAAVDSAAETDETYADMGEIFIRLGDLPRAAEAFDKSTRRNPTNLQALANLATVYLQLQDPDEAERVLRAILTQDDRHAVAYNLLGILYIQKGEDVLARRNFEKAVQFDPGLTEPYLNLGILAQEAGENELAVSYYRQFVERASPRDHREVLDRVQAILAELEGTKSP